MQYIYLLNELHFIWGIDSKFEGDYYQDYKLLCNYLPVRTAWTDKYSTTLFSPTNDISTSIQPIPDLLRWISNHELHYMPSQEATLLQPGSWDEIPGLFLPSEKLNAQVRSTLETDRKWEMWKECLLYKTKPKELKKLCRSLKIPVPHVATKHELVELISKTRKILQFLHHIKGK